VNEMEKIRTSTGVLYLHVNENIFKHVETGLYYFIDKKGRIFDTSDFKEYFGDGILNITTDLRMKVWPDRADLN
jgi:hypothetical protein